MRSKSTSELNPERLWREAETEEIISLYFPRDVADNLVPSLNCLMDCGYARGEKKEIARTAWKIWWKLCRALAKAEEEDSWDIYISCCEKDLNLLGDTIHQMQRTMYGSEEFPGDSAFELTNFMYYIRGSREDMEKAKRRWVMDRMAEVFV